MTKQASHGAVARLLSVFLLVCLAGCGSTGRLPQAAVEETLGLGWRLQDAAKVSQGGEDISQPGFAATGWMAATVPGTVLTSLVNNGVYPEPLYGQNNRPSVIPDSLCRTSYWYRTEFTPPAEFAGQHVWLNLAGINFIAEVWVNGRAVGSVRGAFVRGVFDITENVEPGQTACVAVHIFPPPHPGVPHEHTVTAGMGGNGGILSEDGPTFLCTLGWDWMPAMRDRDMGIWRKLTVSASGPVVLRDPWVSSDLKGGEADLTVETTASNVTDQAIDGELHGEFSGVRFDAPVTLAARETKVVRLKAADCPQLHLPHPRLWWPNGYGPANLYRMRLWFGADGAVSDVKDVTFGVRKITYAVAGSENLTISVNGVPVMCKGGDWGMDEAMKRIPRDRLEAQIRLHRDANLNMIRNWVGQSSSDDFYELCDQYGIMVWDEFFQPNRSDGPDVLDTAMYLENVRDKVRRFRGHPSIVIWCGRNESDPAPAAVEEGIARIMAEEDPTRLYHPNSAQGRGVRSGGPYCWRTPRSFYVFGEAFKTEVGSVSVPTIEAIHAMMPAEDWETVNDDWAEHDLARGAAEGRRLTPMYPDLIAQRYGAVANLPDFVRKAQLANYEAFRAMFEGRFAKLFNPCTGVLTWMSNPAQPSFVWQLYSYDLEPNASLFAVKKACEPVHIQMNQNDFHVMVINHMPRRFEAMAARAAVYDMDGQLKAEQRIVISAEPSAATDYGEIEWPTDLSPVHFVKLELRDRQGRLVSDNFYWRARPDREDDFTELQKMPTVPLDCQVVRHDEGDKCLLDVALANSSNAVALLAHIQLRRSSGQRVLPVFYGDNYVSLLPGEQRSISVEAATADLQGEEPAITVDGWNVTTADRSFGNVTIAANKDAKVESKPRGIWTVLRQSASQATKPATRPLQSN